MQIFLNILQMKIINLPSNFLAQIEESVCTISDDSRFMYLISCKKGTLEIMVYDIMFNKCITLLPDSSATELFKQTKGFKLRLQCDVELVSDIKLLILFNHKFFLPFDISAMLILVELDFSNKTFSLVDNRIYRDCYYGALFKDGAKFGFLHTFAIDKEMHSDDEFFGFFHLQIDNNQIKQINEDRIAFDFEVEFATMTYEYHLYDNKLWILYFKAVDLGQRYRNNTQEEQQQQRPTKQYQLSYFNLNESKPKENQIQKIDITIGEQAQWIQENLIFYDEKEGEFSILNLTNLEWSRLKNAADLIPFGIYSNELIGVHMSPRILGTLRTYKLFLDQHFNVTFINKNKNELQKIALKDPLKLGDIVWTNALNQGMINDETQKLPNNLIYSKRF